MHQTEKSPTQQEIELGKSDERRGKEVSFPDIGLDLSSTLQNSAAEQGIQRFACSGLVDQVLERLQPIRRVCRDLAQNVFHSIGDKCEVHCIFFKFGGRGLGQQLHQQKIYLVTVRLVVHRFANVVLCHDNQSFFIDPGGGLQELTQLMDLNQSVHLMKPLTSGRDIFLGGDINS